MKLRTQKLLASYLCRLLNYIAQVSISFDSIHMQVISNQSIPENLVLAEDAIKSAIKDYRSKRAATAPTGSSPETGTAQTSV